MRRLRGSTKGWKGWKGGRQPYVRVIISMVLMAIIPVLIIEWMSDAFLVKTMKDVQIQALQSNSKVISQYISDFFQDQKEDSQLVISNSPMRSLLQFKYEGQADQIDWWAKKVQTMLHNSVMYETSIQYARLVDKNGCVVASSAPKQIGTNLVQTQMYCKLMDGETQYTEIMVDKNGKRSLKLALPLFTDGQVIGIFEKVINFQGIAAYLDHKKIGDGGYLYLIGANRGFLYHRQRDQMILPNSEYNDGFELENLINTVSDSWVEESGVFRYRVYGKNITAAYQVIPSLNWLVVSAMDESNFIDAVDVLNLGVAVVGILMGSIAAWLGYRFTRRSIENYQRLSNAFSSILDDTEEVTEIKIRSLSEVLDYVNQTRERVRTVQSRVRLLEGLDCLTGLYNRLGLERVYTEEISGRKAKLAALLLDLDSISFLNEKKGMKGVTAVTGEIGCEIGRIVKNYVGENCVAGHISNEEFLLFYYNWDEEFGANGGADPNEGFGSNGGFGSDGVPNPEALAELLRLDVEDIIFLEQERVFLTAGIGLYYIQEGDCFDQIYKNCSDALFLSQNIQKNQVLSCEELLEPVLEEETQKFDLQMEPALEEEVRSFDFQMEPV